MLITIQKIVSSGDGIGWGDGKTFFVPRVIPGETVDIRSVVPLRRALLATDFRVVGPSPLRQDPPCSLFGRCGGCSFLHIPYPFHLEIKQRILEEFFRQQGERLPVPIITVKIGDFRLRSRAKVQITAGRPAFSQRSGHDLVPFDDCPLLHEGLVAVIREDAPMRADGPLHYEYAPQSGGWIPRDTSVEKVVAGEPFRVSRGSFFQASEAGATALVSLVERVIQVVKPSRVLDLFCGVGLFSRFAVRAGCAVTGIDLGAGDDFAVNVPSGRFLQGDLSRPFPLPPADLIIADPPRAGMVPSLIESIARHPASHLCYVSCDGATFVRDVGRLARRGRFLLRSLTLVDQFPFTARIEIVAHLVRGET